MIWWVGEWGFVEYLWDIEYTECFVHVLMYVCIGCAPLACTYV